MVGPWIRGLQYRIPIHVDCLHIGLDVSSMSLSIQHQQVDVQMVRLLSVV